jgi:peptide/nickel transport system substrate-binding protein
MKSVTVAQSSVDVGDPHICSDSANRNSLIYSIYEPLVTRNDSGRFRPSLAARWAVETDGLTWVFRLREGVEFHNGDAMNADDVVSSLKRVVDPSVGGAYGTQGVYAGYIGDARFQAPRRDTVRIVTREPIADLLDLLSEMPIGPDDEMDSLPNEYIGTGPWMVADAGREEVVLERFKDYWGEAPTAEESSWLRVTEPSERARMVAEREADIGARIGVEGRGFIEGQEDTTISSLDSGLCIIQMFNASEGVCTDRRVRQALNHAVDVKEIISSVKKGAAKPLNGYLTPHHFGYDPEAEPYSYDPGKARELLSEAGYRSGLEIVMDVPTSMPDEAPALAEVMERQYGLVGVEVDVRLYSDRPAYAEMVRAKRIHDMCCFDSSPRSTFRVLREKLHSGAKGPWWQGYSNPEVDRLISVAQRTFNDEARQSVYRQIYRLVRDDAPWVFLYRPTFFWAVGARCNWRPGSDGLIRI